MNTKEQAKHTPGPWEVDISNTVLDVVAGGHQVCGCGYADDEEAEANARLIAAAPDLLAVCKDIRSFLWRSGYDNRMVDAVIRKATGDSMRPIL